MKPNAPDARTPDGTVPSGLRALHRRAVEDEERTLLLPIRPEPLEGAPRERNLARFALGRFRVRYEEQLLIEVDVVPELREKFTAAHTRIEGEDQHGPEVFRRCVEQGVFFGNGEHRTLRAALPLKPQPVQRVAEQNPFVHRTWSQPGGTPWRCVFRRIESLNN